MPDELLKTMVKRSVAEKPPQPDFSDPDIQRLRELLNNPMVLLKGNVETVETPAGPVRVPKAPAGRADPTINNPKLAQAYEFLMKVAPNLRGSIKDVRLGPNEGVFRKLESSGLPPHVYENVNLLGTTDLRDRNITVNPRTLSEGDEGLLEVLTHELTHAAGYGGEAEPEEARNIVRKKFGRPAPDKLLETLRK